MATVYLAYDLRHDRRVALKALKPELAYAVGGHRFLREIRFTAQLDHPHILPLLDSGDAGGVLYYVMPYVEGQSLRDRLTREKQLPLDDVLRITRQVADALSYAHSRGVVHRDIKPENILLAGEHARVTDLGIARAVTAAAGETLTETGIAIGTPAYMSPEQAVGGTEIDGRSDVYALGCVTYEMLAGHPPFTGATAQEILARHSVDAVPSLSAARPAIPPAIERAIITALSKSPADRFSTAARFAEALQKTDHARFSPTRRRMWPVGLAIGLASFAAGVVFWAKNRNAVPTQDGALTRLTSDAGLAIDPALSPDGSLVAFASDRAGEGNLDVWIQQVAGGEPVRLTRHSADEREPVFSPDGTRVAFRSERGGGGIYLVSALGGEPTLLAPGGFGARFSPDGRWLAYHTGIRGASLGGGTTVFAAAKLYVVPATGGRARQIQPDARTATVAAWSPDSRQILILASFETGIESVDWWVTPLEGPATRVRLDALRRQRLRTPYPVAWLPGNRIVFSAGFGDSRNHWTTTLSSRDWQIRGGARRLTSGAGFEGAGSVSGSAGHSRLVFSGVVENVDLWSVALARGRVQASAALTRLTQDAAWDMHPTLTADGKTMIYASTRGRQWRLWGRDLATSRETPLVAAPDESRHKPVLSADGSKLAFWQIERGDQPSMTFVTELSRSSENGFRAAEPRRLPSSAPEGSGWPWSWSPSGENLWYDPARWPRLAPNYLYNPRTGEQLAELGHPKHDLAFLHYSPDGRWLAFTEQVSDNEARLVVTPVRGHHPGGPSEWLPIASGDLSLYWHAWSPDGDVIYYQSDRDGFVCVWAQRLTRNTMKPAAPPVAIYHAHSARLSISSVGPVLRGIAAARDRIVFNMSEMIGNIWMTNFDNP